MAIKITDQKIKSLLKFGDIGRHALGQGLYFRVTENRTGLWAVRYVIHNKRREITLGQYPEMSLADANLQAALIKKGLLEEVDPLAERHRLDKREYNTINDVAEDWLEDCARRLKYPNIPRRVYTKDIAPSIGELGIGQVTSRDIRALIRKITESGRPTVANDALLYCKQLFRHAMKLDLRGSNPAEPFNCSDAGGIEESRSRALSYDELVQVFSTFRQNSDQFARENYIACALLVTLGVRKGELIGAQWQEFELKKALWHVPKDRSKTGRSVTVPLPDQALVWLHELKIRSCNSTYVFPNRRASIRSDHISPDTINAAVQKLFRQKKMPVPHFTIHDFRRTCRSLLSAIGVASHVAERCLNHKLKGVEGIYDRYDYLPERKEALQLLSKKMEAIIQM